MHISLRTDVQDMIHAFYYTRPLQRQPLWLKSIFIHQVEQAAKQEALGLSLLVKLQNPVDENHVCSSLMLTISRATKQIQSFML